MKKILLILLTLISLTYLSACSSDSQSNNDQEVNQTTIKANEAMTLAEVTENLAVEKTESVEISNEDNLEGLEGIELLKALVVNEPNNLYVVSEMSGSGMNFTTKSYYKDGNYRTEMNMAGLGNQITIFNNDESVTYQYTEGDVTGIKMTEISDMYEEGNSIEVPDLTELVEAETDIMSAKVEMLDGEETVLIETASNEDGVGEISIKMWYSVNYGIPLKYEMLVNGQVTMTSKVTELDAKSKLDSKLFEAPDGVEFVDFNMDSMFDVPGGDD
jgi:hypothetical protein